MKNMNYFKTVVMFALVLVATASLLFASPVTLCYAQGGYTFETEGGGDDEIPASYNSFVDRIDNSGVVTKDFTAESSNELCQLTVEEGTKALTKSGTRLTSILIVEKPEPPTPPPDANAVSLNYDFRPEGATFDPAITVTLMGYTCLDSYIAIGAVAVIHIK